MKTRSRAKRSTRQKLTDDADKYYSWYVRLRDTETVGHTRMGKCITCKTSLLVCYRDPETEKIRWSKNCENGHFIGRSYHITRYEDENNNLQCTRCNKWKHGEREKYKLALEGKYGPGTAERLEELAYKHGQSFKLPLPELEMIIADAKEAIKFYEKEF